MGQNYLAIRSDSFSASDPFSASEVDRRSNANLENLPAGGVRNYLDGAAKVWSREAGIQVYYVLDNENLPTPPFVPGQTEQEFDVRSREYLRDHRGQPNGNSIVDAGLRTYFTHAIILSNAFKPVAAAGWAVTAAANINDRGFYLDTRQVQNAVTIHNATEGGDTLTVADKGATTVAHEFMHVVISPPDSASWLGEHRIAVAAIDEPALMRPGNQQLKAHSRVASVNIEPITQVAIALSGNPALP